VIRFHAQAQHLDLPPLGDFAGTAAMMLTLMQNGEMKITRSLNAESYTLSRCELEEALGGLNDSGILKLLKTYTVSQENDLRKAG
jgi:hypothetical protein